MRRLPALLFCVAVLALAPGCGNGNAKGGDGGTGGGGGGGGDDQPPGPNTCKAPARPPTTAVVKLQSAYTGFNGAVGLFTAPGDATHVYIIEQGGKGFVADAQHNTQATATLFVDLKTDTKNTLSVGSESGFLGIAFSPKWASNHTAYLSYTAASGAPAGFSTILSRVQSSDGGKSLDLSTEKAIFTLDQPYTNHNGGNIVFGPDGYLYFGLGDGGSGGDPQTRAKNTGWLFGKMLRLDVEGQTTYAIPPTNPFAASGVRCGDLPNRMTTPAAQGCQEVFAWGLRNPWRWSFDSATGDLWIGDVGQDKYEEVDHLLRGKVGANFGWNVREGLHCYNATTCDHTGMTDPVIEYPHDSGNNCVIGGSVYNGALAAIQGSYFFGDNGSGNVWRLTYDTQGNAAKQQIGNAPGLTSFGTDAAGEIYAVTGGGTLFKIVDNGSPPPSNFPALLSQTGCVQSDATKPIRALIPYDVNTPLWSDGAEKHRYLSLPDGGKIHVNDDGDWDLPVGTVLMKEFALGGKLVETRLLVHHDDGDWAGYSYEWNDAQTEATLLAAGKDRQVGSLTWHYPAREECLRCHTTQAGRSLGLEIAQLNRDFAYGSGTQNQLQYLADHGLFDAPLPGAPSMLQALVAVDSQAPVDQRARSYLHANCSFCHRPMGPGRGPADFRYLVTFKGTGVCNADPTEGNLGVAGAKLLAPGHPELSVLSLRTHALDVNRMPPLATTVVDTAGTQAIDAWIRSVTACP